MEAYFWIPVDFVFDFSGTSASAGDTVQTGQSANYYTEVHGLTTPEPFRLDNESVAEISGIEIFGPYDENRRIRVNYVKPVIDGKEVDMLYINERMAPAPSYGMQDALRIAGMRYGHAAINLGMPILAGGDPVAATPKIGPSETLSMRVALPPTAEHGDATVSSPMVVRAWLAVVKGAGKLNAILEANQGDRFANGVLDCSMTVGDLETGNIETIGKQVGSTGEFRLSDWTQLPGGSDADKPKSEQYITYAINRNATTTNQWYRFTMSGNNVYYPWQQLVWNNTLREAVRITHVGVSYETNLRQVRLYRSNRAFDMIYSASPGRNALPLPALLSDASVCPGGPAELTRSFLVWNENGSIEIRDNGTSIPAVSATEQGVMVAVYGKKFIFE